MKWAEIQYFLDLLKNKQDVSILDIWCWNGRFYWALQGSWLDIQKYSWVDLSSWLLEEARKIYPGVNFQEKNMLDISELSSQFNNIFFIASFHHLENIDDRLSVLQQSYNILEPGWMIYMTNWSLSSKFNTPKYSKDIISDSQNNFWSLDYSIKFWEYPRYYHGFTLDELNYLFTETWFEIIENREFDTGKNFISIIKKPLS